MSLFDKIKFLFKRKEKQQVNGFTPPKQMPPRRMPNSPYMTPVPVAPSSTESDNFALGMVLGMTTHDPLTAGLLSGSFTSALIGASLSSNIEKIDPPATSSNYEPSSCSSSYSSDSSSSYSSSSSDSCSSSSYDSGSSSGSGSDY